MAINDSFKLDLAFKKLGFGVQSTSVNKAGYEEAIASPVPTYNMNIWAEAASIPSPASAVTNIVELVESEVLTEDVTVANKVVWLSSNKDFIPASFDAGYVVKVYDSRDIQVFPGSTNYFFDYTSGTLVFPNGSSSFIGFTPPFKITAYKYIGKKGIEGGGGGTGPRINLYESSLYVDALTEGTLYLPFMTSGYITGIKVSGDENTGNFTMKMYTKHPYDGGKYVYYSGVVSNLIWDVPENDIPYIAESSNKTVYIVLDNQSDIGTTYNIQIYTL